MSKQERLEAVRYNIPLMNQPSIKKEKRKEGAEKTCEKMCFSCRQLGHRKNDCPSKRKRCSDEPAVLYTNDPVKVERPDARDIVECVDDNCRLRVDRLAEKVRNETLSLFDSIENRNNYLNLKVQRSVVHQKEPSNLYSSVGSRKENFLELQRKIRRTELSDLLDNRNLEKNFPLKAHWPEKKFKRNEPTLKSKRARRKSTNKVTCNNGKSTNTHIPSLIQANALLINMLSQKQLQQVMSPVFSANGRLEPHLYNRSNNPIDVPW